MSTTTTVNAFTSTRDMFRTYICYKKPLSYDQWSALPDDHKAAALYVQFFEQITLAWNKVKSFYTVEEDGVSTIMQYLMKNVPVIEGDDKRFNAKYIYRVAYNCLYCICHDIKRDRDRYEMETSNIVVFGDESIDLFDTVVGEDTIQTTLRSQEFWALLEQQDEDTFVVINKLLGGTADGTIDKFGNSKKVKIDDTRWADIIADLRVKLEPMREVYGI